VRAGQVHPRLKAPVILEHHQLSAQHQYCLASCGSSMRGVPTGAGLASTAPPRRHDATPSSMKNAPFWPVRNYARNYAYFTVRGNSHPWGQGIGQPLGS
jgi:hypothetical protein